MKPSKIISPALAVTSSLEESMSITGNQRLSNEYLRIKINFKIVII